MRHVDRLLALLRDVVVILMVLSTLQSGLQYLWKATVLLRGP
jgi:hypothetical protein